MIQIELNYEPAKSYWHIHRWIDKFTDLPASWLYPNRQPTVSLVTPVVYQEPQQYDLNDHDYQLCHQ